MPHRVRNLRARIPRLWEFALEHLLLLPAGAAIALVWANVLPESYYSFSYAIAFAVNGVAMAFFFALMTKQVVEATAPGGVLHPWRRALLPVIAAIAATTLSAAIHMQAVSLLDEPALTVAWPVTFATDLAFSYFVARIICGRHPIVPFVLLLAIASDALGGVAIAVFHPTEVHHFTKAGAVLAVALGLAMALRRARAKSFWPYLLIAGSTSWFAFWWSGLPPALGLVPIMPFLPHAARDPGFFVDARPDAKDTLSQFELVWRYPAQIALLLFGLVNAGVPLHELEPGTFGVPIALIVGKPLGVLLGAGVAVAAGLRLPHGVGWRELIVIGLCAAIGFSVALFFSAALLPPGQLRAETSMGALLSLVAVPLALVAARLLRVGRFAR